MEYYLDVASTGKYRDVDNIIIDTITDAMKKYWHNPSSLYATDVKKEIDKCRTNIAKFVGAESDEIYFTSGASESNSWCIKGFIEANDNPLVISTPIEHKSIISCIGNTKGCVSFNVLVDENGMVELDDLEQSLKGCCKFDLLVSIGLANSEIGVIQDIKAISDLVHKYNGVLHVDATQALPSIPIDVKDLGIDIMSASGHKLSPILKGIGFLYIKNGIKIQPLIYGSQQQGLRGGTENVFGIIGFSKAIDYCDVSYKKIMNLAGKRNYFIDILKDKFGCKLNGHPYNRLPSNINVTFPQNITGESLLYTLDMSDIKIGIGSACNSHNIEPSYILKTIGLTDEEAMRTVRFTLPNDIIYEEIDYVINEIEKSLKLIET